MFSKKLLYKNEVTKKTKKINNLILIDVGFNENAMHTC